MIGYIISILRRQICQCIKRRQGKHYAVKVEAGGGGLSGRPASFDTDRSLPIFSLNSIPLQVVNPISRSEMIHAPIFRVVYYDWREDVGYAIRRAKMIRVHASCFKNKGGVE
jgi:hypothetical protein